MNLDFLDVLSQPTQKATGTKGTLGTSNIGAVLRVPNVVSEVGNKGNKTPVPTADTEDCSRLFPSCSQSPEEEKPNVYAPVPNVPTVPKEDEQLWNVEIKEHKVAPGASLAPEKRYAGERQVLAWVRARCKIRRACWGAEKFLYRDFSEWCEQSRHSPCGRELFRCILSEAFLWDTDGWQGIVLASDFEAIAARTMTQ